MVCAILQDIDGDIRIAATKCRQHPTKIDALQAGDDPQVQRALTQAGIIGHFLLKRLCPLEDFPCPHYKFTPRFCQHCPTWIA